MVSEFVHIALISLLFPSFLIKNNTSLSSFIKKHRFSFTDEQSFFTFDLSRSSKIYFDFFATAEGYVEGQDSFTVNVDAPEQVFDAIDLELPEWIIYIVIGGILMVGVVVFMFLKKSKANLEEEWEEEEI